MHEIPAARIIRFLMKTASRETRRRWQIFLCECVVFTCAFWLIVFSSLGQPTFAGIHGRLRVGGNQIVDQNGEPTVLHGMSLYAWSAQGKQFYNGSAIDQLARDWKCTVIRAVVLPRDYRRDPEAEIQRVKTVVDACITNGIYVIINWHAMSGAQNNVPSARAFYTNMAMAYCKSPNVMYEPWNEPVQESWSVIKSYHEAIISSIRPIDPQGIIICGCRHWDQECEEASLDPITISSNLAYSVHFYAGSHRQPLRDNATSALQNGIALFCTEYGTCAASGGGALDPTETRLWWNWLEEHKIGSANWSVSALNETSAAFQPGTSPTGPWTDSMLKPSGILVRDYIRSHYRLR